MKNVGKRVAGYARVSDESQVQGHSLDAQRSEIRRWCEQNDYLLGDIYADEGVSAYTDKIEKRPQFAALLHDAEAGRFDLTVVHTLDRWARNSAVLAKSLERLGKAGVGFVSVTEQIDYTTPAGKMVLTTLGAAQEFFSAQTGVHVRKCHREMAANGIAVGPVPFGYHRVSAGAIQVDEAEAEAIRAAFQRRMNGASYGQIAAWLNGLGLRTRNGRRFTAHAVKDILQCKVYAGLVSYGDEEFPGRHEPIVPRELFDAVQRMRRRRTGARLISGDRGVLQGRVSCLRCGHPLHSDRQYRTGRPMYRERHACECPTNDRACMAAPVDDQIGDLFAALAIPTDWRERMATLADKRGCRRVDLAALHEHRRRIMRIYEDQGYSDAEYQAKLAAMDAEIRAAQPRVSIRAEESLALFRDLPALWAEATSDERSRLLAPLVERVYVDVASRHIGAITAASGFETLLQRVLEQPGWSACVLVRADAADQPDWWTWWRRGRIELPLQTTPAAPC